RNDWIAERTSCCTMSRITVTRLRCLGIRPPVRPRYEPLLGPPSTAAAAPMSASSGTCRRPGRPPPASRVHPASMRRQGWDRGAPGSPYSFSGTQTAVGLHRRPRSEEHTSELQSLRHLVCRLLLEKKKEQHLTDRSGQPDHS